MPADPAKDADNTYTYAFAGWDKEVVLCAGNATYTATYKSAYIDYTVKFVDEDGTVISEETYHYGGKITVPTDPAKAADNTYTYTFAGWDKEVVDCAGNATYTATYNADYIDYVIKFVDEDGTVISEKSYHYGDKVTVPADPAKAADNTYTYTFAGWDKEVVDCAGNATYTATYNADYIDYVIKFVDEDGTVISEKSYHYGDKVTVPADPAKAADNTYTYTFAGWDKEVVDCAGDATYTATYESNYIDYVVKFLDEDGTVISERTYHFGDKVTAPTDPTKAADNTYTYTFAGWDSEVVSCAGNAAYTATYNSHYIDYTVVFENEDGTALSSKTYHYGDKVTVPADPSKDADNTYTYSFAGWDKEVVDCVGDATYTATYKSAYIDYTVVFKNWNGDVLFAGTYHYGQDVVVPATPTRDADETYTYSFQCWDEDVEPCYGDKVYVAEYRSSFIDYIITFQYEDGTVIAKYTCHYGEELSVPENVAVPEELGDNYAFAGWDMTVTVCEGDAVYTAVFEQTYTLGDADGDGEVTDWDGVTLARYLAGWPVEVEVAALDIDGDGEITDWDGVLMDRYLAGWNITIG